MSSSTHESHVALDVNDDDTNTPTLTDDVQKDPTQTTVDDPLQAATTGEPSEASGVEKTSEVDAQEAKTSENKTDNHANPPRNVIRRRATFSYAMGTSTDEDPSAGVGNPMPYNNLGANAVHALIQYKNPPRPGSDVDEVKAFERPASLVKVDEKVVEAAYDQEFRDVLQEILDEEGEVLEDVKMDLSFQDLTFSVPIRDPETGKKGEKTILHNLNGLIPSGKTVAIMGPSGCGKTTLLDMLSGKKTLPYTGEIMVNGNPRTEMFKRLVSYVPQFDYCGGLETVQEALEFVSNLKADYGNKEYREHRYKTKADEMEHRKKHIETLLAVLGLEKVKDSRIGNEAVRGISGGQKRRVTLAKGVITGPLVLFADEPTSGLSATDSELVVRALRNISQMMRVTVICVIHQPRQSVFEMFDHLMLLSEGHCVYNGPREETAEFFATLGYPVPQQVNAADWYLDCITPGAPGANHELFISKYTETFAEGARAAVLEHRENTGKTELELMDLLESTKKNSVFVTSRWQQIKIVTKRQLMVTLRDPDTIGIILVNNVFMAILMGLVYLNIRDRQVMYQLGFIFTLMITAMLNALNFIPSLVSDRVIFENERAEGLYQTSAYMVSKLLVTLIQSTIANTMLTIPSYFMGGFEAEFFGYFWLMILVAFLAVDSIVSICASVSKTQSMANSIAGLIIGFLTLFNGFTANTVSTPLWISWICYISPFYWAFMGVVEVMYETYDFSNDVYPSYEALLASFGFKGGNRWLAIGIQVIFFVFYRFVQLIALRYYSTLQK